MLLELADCRRGIAAGDRALVQKGRSRRAYAVRLIVVTALVVFVLTLVVDRKIARLEMKSGNCEPNRAPMHGTAKSAPSATPGRVNGNRSCLSRLTPGMLWPGNSVR